MTLKQLSSALEKVFNALGNQYLMETFDDVEPYKFKVAVKQTGPEDWAYYLVEVLADRKMPNRFKFKSTVKDASQFEFADISVVKGYFKDLVDYVNPNMLIDLHFV